MATAVAIQTPFIQTPAGKPAAPAGEAAPIAATKPPAPPSEAPAPGAETQAFVAQLAGRQATATERQKSALQALAMSLSGLAGMIQRGETASKIEGRADKILAEAAGVTAGVASLDSRSSGAAAKSLGSFIEAARAYGAQGASGLAQKLGQLREIAERALHAPSEPTPAAAPAPKKAETAPAAPAQRPSALGPPSEVRRTNELHPLRDRWGIQDGEIAMTYPCDALVKGPTLEMYRGLTIDASPDTVYKWLCQMRVAPYSYDLLDNFGRQSPKTLTPGLADLKGGEAVMTMFRVASFEPGRHITLTIPKGNPASWGLPGLAVSYVCEPSGEGSTRVLVKMAMPEPQGILRKLLWKALGWGDLIMMRKQLLTFKDLAENSAGKNVRSGG